jgi:hypothetical protein
MAWVKTDAGAAGLSHVLASHSLNADASDALRALYHAVVFGASGLARAEREAVAVCVSAANDCHY